MIVSGSTSIVPIGSSLATMRGESPYSLCAQAKRIAKIPSVATRREIAGAVRNGRITKR